MVPFNHTESRYTPNCLVIKKQKVNVIRIGYKYSTTFEIGVAHSKCQRKCRKTY